MKNNKLVRKIKNIKWDNRVQRAGFLQSKQITNNAEIKPIKLIKNITVQYDNIFWVNDFALYDEVMTKKFSLKFKQAFENDKKWPKKKY